MLCLNCPVCLTNKTRFHCVNCADERFRKQRASLTAPLNERKKFETALQSRLKEPPPESLAAHASRVRCQQLSRLIQHERELAEQEAKAIADQRAANTLRRQKVSHAAQYLKRSKRSLNSLPSINRSLNRDLEKLSSSLGMARRKLVLALLKLLVIKRRDEHHCTIVGIILPDNAYHIDLNELYQPTHVAAAFGYVVLLLSLIARYLAIPLPIRMHYAGSRSYLQAEGHGGKVSEEAVLTLEFDNSNGTGATPTTALVAFRKALQLLDHNVRFICAQLGLAKDEVKSFHILPNMLLLIQAIDIDLPKRLVDTREEKLKQDTLRSEPPQAGKASNERISVPPTVDDTKHQKSSLRRPQSALSSPLKPLNSAPPVSNNNSNATTTALASSSSSSAAPSAMAPLHTSSSFTDSLGGSGLLASAFNLVVAPFQYASSGISAVVASQAPQTAFSYVSAPFSYATSVIAPSSSPPPTSSTSPASQQPEHQTVSHSSAPVSAVQTAHSHVHPHGHVRTPSTAPPPPLPSNPPPSQPPPITAAQHPLQQPHSLHQTHPQSYSQTVQQPSFTHARHLESLPPLHLQAQDVSPFGHRIDQTDDFDVDESPLAQTMSTFPSDSKAAATTSPIASVQPQTLQQQQPTSEPSHRQAQPQSKPQPLSVSPTSPGNEASIAQSIMASFYPVTPGDHARAGARAYGQPRLSRPARQDNWSFGFVAKPRKFEFSLDDSLSPRKSKRTSLSSSSSSKRSSELQPQPQQPKPLQPSSVDKYSMLNGQTQPQVLVEIPASLGSPPAPLNVLTESQSREFLTSDIKYHDFSASDDDDVSWETDFD